MKRQGAICTRNETNNFENFEKHRHKVLQIVNIEQ